MKLMEANSLCFKVLISVFLILTIEVRQLNTVWWSLGIYHLNSKVICDHIPGLVRQQRFFCKRMPLAMLAIAKGANLAVRECQHQFRYHQWNCSIRSRDKTLFGKKILFAASRETAFVHAITAAGAVHSLTDRCSRGHVIGCRCDPYKNGYGQDVYGQFSWGGCSQFLRFSTVLVRKFVDAQEKPQKDARALMNLHNNKVGRKAVFDSLRRKCKCHGVSGSCTVRTCWRVMSGFRQVGDLLKSKYDTSVIMMMGPKGDRLVTIDDSWKTPSKHDLVYLGPSPDFCKVDYSTDFPNTDRVCNKTSQQLDSCDIICCGHGYQTQQKLVTFKCRCKFFWCCRVKCEVCSQLQLVNTCRRVAKRKSFLG